MVTENRGKMLTDRDARIAARWWCNDARIGGAKRTARRTARRSDRIAVRQGDFEARTRGLDGRSVS